MLELILLVVISIGIGKVASSDGQSGIVWGALTGGGISAVHCV